MFSDCLHVLYPSIILHYKNFCNALSECMIHCLGFFFFFFKAVSYYLINGSKLNTKIKGTLKFIPWSIKMYFGLDVNVKEKKDLMNSLLAKYSTAAALNLKHFFPFCRAYYFSLKNNHWEGCFLYVPSFSIYNVLF